MKNPPTSVSATLILIVLISAFWFVFAIIAALGIIPSVTATGLFRWVMVVLALGVSVVLAGMALLLRRRHRAAYFACTSLLVIIAVLSITDQVGLLDLISLAISLTPLGLMLKDRAWYLGTENAASTRD